VRAAGLAATGIPTPVTAAPADLQASDPIVRDLPPSESESDARFSPAARPAQQQSRSQEAALQSGR
jgi:hypothetical protein